MTYDRPLGQRQPQLDAMNRVTGRAAYIADLYRPGMLHGAIAQSDYAHARIKGYDLTEALVVPGVVAIVTGEDFDLSHRMGAFVKDEMALAIDKVRYLGEPVAAVAAETEVAARRAAQLIIVHCEELPELLTPEDALAADAPLIHEDLGSYFKVFDAVSYGNVLSETEMQSGDVDAAWAECAHIVEGDFTTQPQAHLSIEPVGALAEADANGQINLWSANQSVHRVQSSVSESLGIPQTRIRSMTPAVGAGFGNKMEAHIQPITVALALKSGRPVKMILTREQDFETVRARHPFKIRMKTGAAADGRLIARQIEVLLECGAYGDDSPGVLGYSLLMAPGPYRIPHIRSRGRLVYTNRMRFGAFRGFGNVQVTFAGESQIDQLADLCGLDPAEMRLRNILRSGESWFTGAPVGSNGLRDCIERARDAAGWDAGRPLGMAVAGQISGLLGTGAIVRMQEDGTIVLGTGAVDIGQGSDTVLAQLCADTLQIPIEMVRVPAPDTDHSPFNWGTTASRVTFMTGNSVVQAAGEVAAKIRAQAAEIFDCAPEDMELLPGGRVGITGTDNAQLSFADIAKRSHWRTGGPIIGSHSWVFDTPTIDPKRAVGRGIPFQQIGGFSFGCAVVEMAVDDVTGKASVARGWSAMDVGRAVNPMTCEGQMEGGFVQAVGYALSEEMVWDGARLANPSMMDYKAPTAMEAPPVECILVEAADPQGPCGAKGLGEICMIPVPGAIGNAMRRLTGQVMPDLPYHPERVLNAMESAP